MRFHDIQLFLRIAVLFLTLQSGLSFAHAFEAKFEQVLDQGTTMEVQVPKAGIASLEGQLGSHPVVFHEVALYPKDDGVISRGAFLEMLFANYTPFEDRVLEQPEQGFPDISGEESYAQAVLYAQSLGLVHGYEDGLFHPSDPLTRAQAAKILVQAFQPRQVILDVPFFTDFSPRHALASFMYDAIRAGLYQGYGDGTIKMDRHLNYLEAETLTRRAVGDSDENTGVIERNAVTSFIGYVGAHRTNDSGVKMLTIKATTENGEYLVQEYPVQIRKVQYKTNSFTLPPSKTQLFENTAYNTTWKMIDEAKHSTEGKKLWEGTFIVPTTGEVSMGFGDTVIINGKLSGSHFGIDYANKTGTPVLASNTGRVVLSANTPSYGNTIIIDHGMNVFTMYMHMSELIASEGQEVSKEEKIGTIGATGIATGPHLHFTHFIGDVIVDSKQWFAGDFE